MHQTEKRGDKWFVTFPSESKELAPVFDLESTADEVGRHNIAKEAYFDGIPRVPLGTPYPRPESIKAPPAPFQRMPTRKY